MTTDQISSKVAPNSDVAYVIARAGFQALSGANNAISALFDGFAEIGEGTAGSAMQIPTNELANLLRSLAEILETEYLHQPSGDRVTAAQAIDNWSIAIQAKKPTT